MEKLGRGEDVGARWRGGTRGGRRRSLERRSVERWEEAGAPVSLGRWRGTFRELASLARFRAFPRLSARKVSGRANTAGFPAGIAQTFQPSIL